MNPSSPPPSSLLDLLRDPAQRDEGFRQLMKRYGRNLYWHIRRIVVGREDAEDVLQETCVKVLASLESFRGDEAQLMPWIYRIATRECLQLLRSRTSIFQSIDSLGDSLTETLRAENQLNAQTAEMLLQEALLKLPTTQRIVFNLRYFDDMSYEEIAAVTGKKVGTLKTNYHFASERVKQYVKDHSQ